MYVKDTSYKISGNVPSGRHRCLWCEIGSGDLIKPREERGRFPARSLDSLRADHNDFLVRGNGNLVNAKFFNNVISKHLLEIDINQVKLNV